MTQFKVMTFNIRVRSEVDGPNIWDHRIETVAEVMETSGAPIIGVQEARYDMLPELQEALPSFKWVGSSRAVDAEDEYCPIFYQPDKVTLIEHGTFWLSETPDIPGSQSWDSSCPRICTWAVFELPSGERFTLYNTHLDHISEAARVNGIQVIFDRIHEQGDHPFMIMGDFNAKPDSETVQFISQKEFALTNVLQKEINRGEAKTFHNFQGGTIGMPIDYIFISKELRLIASKILSEKVHDRFPSDHYPIVAEVAL